MEVGDFGMQITNLQFWTQIEYSDHKVWSPIAIKINVDRLVWLHTNFLSNRIFCIFISFYFIIHDFLSVVLKSISIIAQPRLKNLAQFCNVISRRLDTRPKQPRGPSQPTWLTRPFWAVLLSGCAGHIAGMRLRHQLTTIWVVKFPGFFHLVFLTWNDRKIYKAENLEENQRDKLKKHSLKCSDNFGCWDNRLINLYKVFLLWLQTMIVFIDLDPRSCLVWWCEHASHISGFEVSFIYLLTKSYNQQQRRLLKSEW